VSLPLHRRRFIAWPLLATVLLLIVLLGGYSWVETRRLEQNLAHELDQRAISLISLLEAGIRNAITSQAALEEVVAQRLLDNARFVDFVVGRSPRAEELIARLASEHKLAKVDLLDDEGRPLRLPVVEIPGPGRGMGMRRGAAPSTEDAGQPTPMMPPGMMRPPDGDPQTGPARPGMFMWGLRWGGPRGDPHQLFPSLPKDATIRRFWEGSAFGVAVPAQSFKGIIAVHADSQYLLNVRREVGPQRLVEDLGKQSGVTEAALLDNRLTILASSDANAIGRIDNDPFLQQARAAGTLVTRLRHESDRDVLDAVKPIRLGKYQDGLVRLGISAGGHAEVTAQARRNILWYSLGLLGVGVLGSVAIFALQARYLAEREQLEAAVVKEQRLAAMGNLAAGVAHEIRNPLNAISVGLQRLRLEFAPADVETKNEYLGFTRVIESEVRRLNAMVDRFLTLARPLRLTLTPQPMAPVLNDLLALVSPQASAQAVQVAQDIGLDDAAVPLDREQVAHALMNVLQNALQAMPGGGTLTVSAMTDQTTVQIAISDTGPGIPPENVDRIFEPYFTTKEGGTGLGLALTRRIVLEHRGTIETEPVTRGARFVIRLPRAGTAAA